ncbi:MAG: hypothetical protein GY757_23135 [bacterium]|nr:hypothetical protein [bacterium]
MKKVFNLAVLTLLAAILAFSGCEAGLSNSSNSTDDDSKFSFSEMYNTVAAIQQDNTAIRAELAAMNGDVTTGNNSLADEINLLKTEIAVLNTLVVPVGTIVAWDKSFGGVPALGDKFAECDGSEVSDVDSPLKGQILPDLNGEGRFLRGASTSGTFQNDQMQNHRHDVAVFYRTQHRVFEYSKAYQSSGWQTNHANNSTKPTTGVIGARIPGAGDTVETRPINMSVVWIMRIK